MSEIVADQLWDAARTLILSAIIYFAYKTAKEAGENNGRWIALRNGTLWCIGIAFFAAATMGSPSCEQTDDPIRGGCSEYADDGFDPTSDQRLARFLFWFVLLTAPVVVGVLESRQFAAKPWRRPEVENRDP